jgi:LexA DNA binding domain-containing protein
MTTSSRAEVGVEPTDRSDPGPDYVLTLRLEAVLQAIRDFGQRHGYAPTVREIGKAAGMASPSSVSYQLAVLQRTGYLRRGAKRPHMAEVRLPGQPAIRLEVKDLAHTLDFPAHDIAYVPVPLARSPRVNPTWPGSSPKTPSRCPSSSPETDTVPTAGPRGFHDQRNDHRQRPGDGAPITGSRGQRHRSGHDRREATVETRRRSPDQIRLMPSQPPIHTHSS